MNPVELRMTTANSFPTGTGSYSYQQKFDVIVDDIAYEKHVSIWAPSGATWQDHPATFVERLPNGRQLWRLETGAAINEFDAKYAVAGSTYWDNAGGGNYRLPIVADDFAALLGTSCQVALGRASFAGHLTVDVAVKNLAYAKVVQIVYTTDDWATTHVADCHYDRTMVSGVEVWTAELHTGMAAQAVFAVAYHVSGATYWDNNFWRNYTVPSGGSIAF
jgi:hypothetical protein